MDTALYERGKQLLEGRLAEHRKAGLLEGLRTPEEADLAEILRRDAPTDKQRQHQMHRGKTAAKPRTASKQGGAGESLPYYS